MAEISEPRAVKTPALRTGHSALSTQHSALVVGGAAWALALGALAALGAEPGRTWAMLALAVAGVGAVLAWYDWRAVPAIAARRWAGLGLPWDRARAARLVAIGGAGALAAGADAAFLAD